MKKANAKIIVLIGVIFISFSAIIAKSSAAPAFVIATYRLGFTVLLLLPSVISNKVDEIKNINKRTFVFCILSGFFLALHFAAWISSIQYTSVASTTVLVNTHPIFIVSVSSLFLKKKFSKSTLISIAIALVGSIIISFGDFTLGSNILFGDILAIMGAIFVGAYMMIGRSVRQSLSATSYTFIVYTSGLITLILLCILTKTPLYPYPLEELIRFLMLAVLCTLLGHSVFNWALEYVESTFVSTSVLGEPVFATIWAIFFFKEIPTAWQLVGSLIILCGIYRYTKISEPGRNT